MQVTVNTTAAAAAATIGAVCAPTTAAWARVYAGTPCSGYGMAKMHPAQNTPLRTAYALVQLGHGASPHGTDIKAAPKVAPLADGGTVSGIWLAHHKNAALGGALWANNGTVYTYAPAPAGAAAGALVQQVGNLGTAATFANAVALLVADGGPWCAAVAAQARAAAKQVAANTAAAKLAETAAPVADTVADTAVPTVAETVAETAAPVADTKPVKKGNRKAQTA